MIVRHLPAIALVLMPAILVAQTPRSEEPRTESVEAALTFPKIDRRPTAWDERNFWLHRLFRRSSTDPFGSRSPDLHIETLLGGEDLSDSELENSLQDLLDSSFDTETTWPSTERMPKLYAPKKVLDLGRNPGLRIRRLHASGVTGLGVGVALVDRPLLVEHKEYKDRLKLYEEIHVGPTSSTSVGGPAVASLAVGKAIGVAPGADLYYIGSWAGTQKDDSTPFVWDFSTHAQGVRRILKINEHLPKDQKIRVLAIPLTWRQDQAGYQEIVTACGEAKDVGLFVVSSSLEEMYGFKVYGLDRCPLSDPDNFESYELVPRWPDDIPHQQLAGRLLVPADARTVAGYRGDSAYRFQRRGSWRSVIPYIAGLYALACQVEPKTTPERFWESALKTGRAIRVQQEGMKMPGGRIIDPGALMDVIRRE